MKTANILTYAASSYEHGQFTFTYIIDNKTHSITLSHSQLSHFNEHTIQHIGFNIGMCYLIDIAEIVLPSAIKIFAHLSPDELLFWKKLYEDVAKEKMFALNLDLSLLEIPWSSNTKGQTFTPFTIAKQKNGVCLCLTGGKESLALLKLMSGKKDISLFYLNLDNSVHRQKVFSKFEKKYKSIRNFSNRYDALRPIKKQYGRMFSGVDMAHLVFNTLLFADQYTSVLIGNEYGSNLPNEIYQGYPINHQFVKTIDFAKRLNSYLHSSITKDYSYYSPFFTLHEYRIADILFSDNEYLDVWTSCNQTTEKINFCSNCAKCAFTYLVSRVRRDKKFLSKFFSRNLLEDTALYKPLMDFVGKKPLDCVGDKKEVWVALDTLCAMGEKEKVLTYFKKNIYPHIKEEIGAFRKEIMSFQTVPVDTPEYLTKLVKKSLLKK